MYKGKWPLLALILSTGAWLASSVALADQPALPIDIEADVGRYDVPSGAYHLTGNVRIARGALVVTANEARSFSSEAGQVERIELFGTPTRWRDVLEDGSDVDGESDQVVYDFVQNTITMVGNAHIRNVQGAFSGATLVYDLDSQSLVGDGGVRLIIEPAASGRVRAPARPDPDAG